MGETNVTYGTVEAISPLVRRILAPNPGPFTFTGTGTFIVGHGKVAIIDPGPAKAEHVAAILSGVGGEFITHILVTHTHLDHSGAARHLKEATGAPIYAAGPHGLGRVRGEEAGRGGDTEFIPDQILAQGDVVVGDGWSLEAIHTPGHASNHLCFALPAEDTLFTGDHVMGWSTSVIIPPDGNMTDYLLSLHRLLERHDKIYRPTHGPAINDPKARIRQLIATRERRRETILARLAVEEQTIETLLTSLYVEGGGKFVAAAARYTILAHLLQLIEGGLVDHDGVPTMVAKFRLR